MRAEVPGSSPVAQEWLRLQAAALEAAANGIVITGGDGRIIWANPAFTKLTGYSLDEALGQNPRLFKSGQQPPAYYEDLWRTVISGRAWHGQLINRRKDGSLYTEEMTVTPVRAGGGAITHFIAIKEDISQRMRAEEALRHSEERYRSLFSCMNEGFALHEIVCDEKGEPCDYRFLAINPAFERQTGLRRERVIGKLHSELLPDDDPKWVKIYGEVALTGRSVHSENYSPALKRHYEMFAFRPAPRQFAVLFMDVTARKLTEERLAGKSRELARSNADLRLFAQVASHDLKEPLRMVASYTQLLAKRYRGKLDADADQFIAFAADGALRMQALIDDLLVYARVDADPAPFKPAECGELVDAAVANLKVLLEEQGARVARGPLPSVSGNASQLIELFQNLVANAVKFHGDRPPRVRVSARRGEGAWEFSVEDNGIGIEPKHFERIFAMFQRLHPRGTYPGTGVGLAVCKKIVERHGGRIWVESTPGEGSIFRFTIPGE